MTEIKSSETYCSEGGIKWPVTEAMLEKQVEFLLDKSLHHDSASQWERRGKKVAR